ncbi:uncharacterized protein LOC107009532 [Solanum pennellii]|uniref:Uncharacterized protein LOC107009532 n=1 Tax=Solanum pennellii TaxID=28526 RepID=A0ABM1G0X2_SOLPN|nr:uncharacterized protein LOC107009532 [Solanum pennellii]
MAAATASTRFHIRGSFQHKGNLQNSTPKRVKAFQSPTEARRPQNVSGEFFVDHTCIDCDTCRWMAPVDQSTTAVEIKLEGSGTMEPR